MKIIAKSLVALFVIASLAFTTFPKKTEKIVTVVVDVSHGGEDTGTSEGTLIEKEIVQQIANKMALLSKDANVQLHFTRTDDSFISLQDRVQFINNLKPDVVLSLHINDSDNTEISGMEVFFSDQGKQSVLSKKLANSVMNTMKAEGIFETSKVKSANFYVLKNSEAPAVAVELGFLSNPKDRSILQNDFKQNEIAKVLLVAISNQ
ncbi:N-acetylmuramoyl-L-alanine amidase family protein [Rasiella sp. SM2506]|uniref:N-acetylmuramoyl-L-alanine amidase family protein n=1 Tax=Rasiella sp. SM2506 TaxID=3423914 RepID=UPI003D79EC28